MPRASARADGTSAKPSRASVAKSFVHDAYFERGHWGLKLRQAVVTTLIGAYLVFPVLVVLNSVGEHEVWSNVYSWTYVDAARLAGFLARATGIIVVVVLAFSIYLLVRNNHREKHVYPKKKVYDEAGLVRRKEILERMYAERFGDDEVRHGSRYYVVAPEQNLPTHFVSGLLEKGGGT